MNLDPYKNLLNLKHHKSHYSVSIYKDTDQDFLFFYGYIHQATGNWGLKGQIGVSGGQKLKGEGVLQGAQNIKNYDMGPNAM